MESENYTKKSTGVIAALAFGLAGSLGYNYVQSNNVSKSVETVATAEKSKMIADLTAMSEKYNTAVANDSTVSQELLDEKAKVEKLLIEVKKSNGSTTLLAEYKQKIATLEEFVISSQELNQSLNNENIKLTQVLELTKKEAADLKANLAEKEEKLTKATKINDIAAAKVTIVGLKALPINEIRGKATETTTAGRVDFIEVSYIIEENLATKPDFRTYYIQVIDPKGQTLGLNKSMKIGNNTINYSFMKKIKYDNKVVKVAENVAKNVFVDGTYTLKVFEGNVIVASSELVLK